MDFVHENALVFDFLGRAHDGDHDFREGLFTFGNEFSGRFEDGADLHFGHFGVGNAKTHAAVAHHGVAFVERVGAFVELFRGNIQALGQFLAFLDIARNKLMERRVQRADGDRIPVHGGKGLFNVFFCKGEQLIERGLAFVNGLGHDHFPEKEKRLLGVFSVEHVLGAEQSDTFGAEGARAGGGFGGLGIRADADFFDRLAQCHEFHEIGIVFGGFFHGQLTEVHIAFSAVKGDPIAFLHDFLTVKHDFFRAVVDVERTRAYDAAFSPAAGDERRMTGHAAARRKNGLGRAHAFDVFGVCFFTGQNDRFAGFCPRNRVHSRENDLT